MQWAPILCFLYKHAFEGHEWQAGGGNCQLEWSILGCASEVALVAAAPRVCRTLAMIAFKRRFGTSSLLSSFSLVNGLELLPSNHFSMASRSYVCPSIARTACVRIPVSTLAPVLRLPLIFPFLIPTTICLSFPHISFAF